MIAASMVVVPVTDLERAKQFYGDVLGLTLVSETPVGVRYRCGSVSEISIFKRAPFATEHTLVHFEVDFEVDDIEAAIQDLEAKGVEVLDYSEGPLVTTGHIAHVGPARGAWFRDPDGNTLGLRQG